MPSTTYTVEMAQETDTRLAALWDEAFEISRRRGWAVDAVHSALGESRDYSRRRPAWPTEDDEAISLARAAATPVLTRPDWADESDEAKAGRQAFWKQQEVLKALAKLDAADEAWAANREAQQPLVDLFEEHRWSRFFLVQNHGGHVHKDMHCSTCFPTTQYGWLPDLSGLDEEAAVASQGAILCSVCYPSAPVEWTMGLPAAPRCAGSGQRPAPGRERYASQPCSVCGKSYPVSRNTGVIRAHKPASA